MAGVDIAATSAAHSVNALPSFWFRWKMVFAPRPMAVMYCMSRSLSPEYWQSEEGLQGTLAPTPLWVETGGDGRAYVVPNSCTMPVGEKRGKWMIRLRYH
jgi:hypothetical protein